MSKAEFSEHKKLFAQLAPKQQKLMNCLFDYKNVNQYNNLKSVLNKFTFKEDNIKVALIFVFDFKYVFDKKNFTDICKSLIDNKPGLANNYFFERTIKAENIDLIAHIMKVNSENNNNPLFIKCIKEAINFAIGNIVDLSPDSIKEIIIQSKDKLAVKDYWNELNYGFKEHNESSNEEDLDISGANKNHYNDDE